MHIIKKTTNQTDLIARWIPVLPGEYWAPLHHNPKQYSVSTKGRLFSWNVFRKKPRGLLKITNCDGYLRVSIIGGSQRYPSANQAGKELNIPCITVTRRCKNPKFPDWEFVPQN